VSNCLEVTVITLLVYQVLIQPRQSVRTALAIIESKKNIRLQEGERKRAYMREKE
jgi:hypothetical protein